MAGVPLRIVLADDHEIVRLGLRNLLERQPGWMVVGEAGDGKKAVREVLETEPDVTLLNIAALAQRSGCGAPNLAQRINHENSHSLGA